MLLFAGLPIVITGLLWATSPFELSLWQILAALLLFWLPWATYQHWYRGSREELPLFALIAGMYWLGYAVPLFWIDHSVNLVDGLHILNETAVTKSLYLAVIGMTALWLGMKLGKEWQRAPSIALDVPQNSWRWHYLRLVLVACALMKVVIPITALGAEVRQLLVVVEVVVPSVAFSVLLRYYLRGRAIDIDKALLTGYFALDLILGMSSGWMGTVVGLALICIATYVLERRKFPVTALLVLLPVVLFLQPGKAKFRERYWQSGPADSYSDYAERTAYWLQSSAQLWGDAITDPSGGGLRNLASSTLTRISLLDQTANVVEMTPHEVPHQGGRLYSYVLITWVPRFLWPSKPSYNDANHWYQLVYRISLPEQLETVSIAVGNVAESYISFGWYGPVLVMFALGLLLGIFQRAFFRANAGLLLTSIGVALLPGLLVLESQMAEYVSGLLQKILVAVIVFLPILQLRHKSYATRELTVAQRLPLAAKHFSE